LTLSIATTRPMKSPVAVTWRLTTGRTDTAGGGAVCAMAAPAQTIATNAPIAPAWEELLRGGIETGIPRMTLEPNLCAFPAF
jgi:hypothetical protein